MNEKDKISSAYVLTDKMSVSMQDAYIFNRDAELNVLYPDGVSKKDCKPLIKKLSMEKIMARKYDEVLTRILKISFLAVKKSVLEFLGHF